MRTEQTLAAGAPMAAFNISTREVSWKPSYVVCIAPPLVEANYI